jgi:transcriptional regulator with GAF, ATPase, and Fis domain
MDTMSETFPLSRNPHRVPDGLTASRSPGSETPASTEQPRRTHPSGHAILTDEEIRNLERENLVRALEVCDWRIQGGHGAAELLGVRPSTLRDRMRAFGIQRPA